jgi:hypothetical protein
MGFTLAKWRIRDLLEKSAEYRAEAQRCAATADCSSDAALKNSAKIEEAYWLRLAEEVDRAAAEEEINQ